MWKNQKTKAKENQGQNKCNSAHSEPHDKGFILMNPENWYGYMYKKK